VADHAGGDSQQFVAEPVAVGAALCAGVDAAEGLQQGGQVPGQQAAHIHAVLVSGQPEGRWIRPAPSLASRMRSSMSVRIRNHASTSVAVSNPAPPVGRLVTMKLVAVDGAPPPRAWVGADLVGFDADPTDDGVGARWRPGEGVVGHRDLRPAHPVRR